MGQGARGKARVGVGRTGRGQGQGRGRKDQARPTPGSECEELSGAAAAGVRMGSTESAEVRTGRMERERE